MVAAFRPIVEVHVHRTLMLDELTTVAAEIFCAVTYDRRHGVLVSAGLEKKLAIQNVCFHLKRKLLLTFISF